MRLWRSSSLTFVSVLLAQASCQTTTTLPRMLADEIGHILVGKPIGPHDLAAAVQDWYLMCLEGDWFNPKHPRQASARTAAAWKKVEEDCHEYSQMEVGFVNEEVIRFDIERVKQQPPNVEALRERWRSPNRPHDRPDERRIVTSVKPVSPGEPRGQSSSDGQQPNAFTIQDAVEGFGKNFGRFMGVGNGESSQSGLRRQMGPRFRRVPGPRR